MKDPKDLLHNFHPNAAFKGPQDSRDYKWSEVGFGSAPFDWSKGYDVEEEIGSTLGIAGFKLPVKDQDGSGSCGGQAEATYGSAVSAIHDRKFVERSAKFPYSQVYVQGGGSGDADLARIATTQGWAPEALCASYENGKPPSEAFMERKQDITQAAKDAAKLDSASSFVSVNIDIDSVAQAIESNHGARLGITGSNNGTWLSADPQPPVDGQEFWYHWIYAGKAKIRNGVKKIGLLNSWGTQAGDNGWQWIDASYISKLLATCPNGRGIWTARAVVVNTNPIASFHHFFASDIGYLQSGPEVVALQSALQADGEFPKGTPCTGLYGDITRRAVLAFQVKYSVASNAEIQGLAGKKVGPATRAKLNKLFN